MALIRNRALFERRVISPVIIIHFISGQYHQLHRLQTTKQCQKRASPFVVRRTSKSWWLNIIAFVAYKGLYSNFFLYYSELFQSQTSSGPVLVICLIENLVKDKHQVKFSWGQPTTAVHLRELSPLQGCLPYRVSTLNTVYCNSKLIACFPITKNLPNYLSLRCLPTSLLYDIS